MCWRKSLFQYFVLVLVGRSRLFFEDEQEDYGLFFRTTANEMRVRLLFALIGVHSRLADERCSRVGCGGYSTPRANFGKEINS